MEYKDCQLTLTPMAIQNLLKLQENSPYSLSQLAEIAIDYYFDECKGAEEEIKESNLTDTVPLKEVISECRND